MNYRHHAAKGVAGVTSDQLDRVIDELVFFTDEISGAPIMVGGKEVWIHTVDQVSEWLRRFKA